MGPDEHVPSDRDPFQFISQQWGLKASQPFMDLKKKNSEHMGSVNNWVRVIVVFSFWNN